jgi:sugar phosphate isomerase/epimerase
VKKPVFINTCVYGVKKMPLIKDYVERYGDDIGFEILSMFDLPDFEQALNDAIPFYETRQISFHGPVFFTEHSAPKGTKAYESSMWHVNKTFEYAKRLHSSHFTMHLNNCTVIPSRKEEMLYNALENYKELQEMFGAIDCPIYVENTGTILEKNMLLDQEEFIDLCRDKKFEVVLDVGHANCNGWDLKHVIRRLSDQIKTYHLHNNDGLHDLHARIHDGTIDFDELMKTILELTPDAELVVEYTKPDMEGPGLHEDFMEVLNMSRAVHDKK